MTFHSFAIMVSVVFGYEHPKILPGPPMEIFVGLLQNVYWKAWLRPTYLHSRLKISLGFKMSVDNACGMLRMVRASKPCSSHESPSVRPASFGMLRINVISGQSPS